jgi:hypothetical protein
MRVAPISCSLTRGPGHAGIGSAQLRRWHWTVLVVGVGVIVLAFSMRIVDGDHVALRILPQSPLPQLCMARAMFGISCPGCGLTRSFILLAEGRWHAAYVAHPMGWLLALLTLLQIPYRMTALAGYYVMPRKAAVAFAGCVLLLLMEAWILKLLSR